MRIGFMRLSMSSELDFINSSAKALGTEIRVGLIEGFLQLGHKVFILNPIPAKQLHILQGSGDFYDYSLFKKVKYYPEKTPKNLDILFIESSVANIFFAERNIKRLIDIFKSFSGTVVYYHHADQLCSFPMGAMIDGERSNFEPTEGISYKNIFKNVPISDKRFVLITPAIPSLLVEKMDTNRFRYSMFDKVVQMDLGYSEEFDKVLRTKSLYKRKYDLIYIGKQKSNVRTKRIISLHGEECCSKVLFGDWKEPLKYFDYKGFVPGHGNIYKDNMYGKAVASVCVGDSFFTDVGMTTTRLIQAIRSGNLSLVDGNFINAKEQIGKEFVINDHQDVHNWTDKSPKEIAEAIMLQRSRLQTWKNLLEPAMEEIENTR